MDRTRIITICTALLLLVLDSSYAPPIQQREIAYAQSPDRTFFVATGQWVEGVFLDYWRERGGLPIFGYPLTPAFWERGYTVQYFERSRFEHHPEWAGSPYEVSLGQLGKERLKAEGRSVPRPGSPTPDGARTFPETGYPVSGSFQRYWERYGSLAQFGYPITPEMQDRPGGLTVQYFERARMELHPEHAGTDHHVLLTLLGVERANALDPTLRTPWSERSVEAQPIAPLQVRTTSAEVPILSPATVTSSVGGELRVLGGDNRHYATYKIEAEKPLTLYAAGASGPQSFVLFRQGEVVTARWNAFRTATPRWGIHTGDGVWDGLYPRVEGYLSADRVEYTSPDNTKPVRGYRSPDNSALWLRDHVYQMKGARYFEPDMQSALDYFATTQRADGSLDDYLYHMPATPVFTKQIEIEADREFLFVEGVWTAWQTTGDDEWLREMLPAMERALEHTFTDPRRWSIEHGLVKRAFTIDMWDYEQGSDGLDIRRSFDERTMWSIMHGDNTGAYRSALILAAIERRFGRGEEARRWEARAEALRASLNRVSWNGSFYTHQVHLTPVLPTGVDESKQLSLSNAYAPNRGTLSHEQALSVLRTYRQRRESNSRIFAEWYSIDPPFEANFGLPGQYANGGVMPLVGGELARGAFEHGLEGYGLDILRRYWGLTERWNGSYLWYHPDGRPGIGTPETLNTDGWGSAAMLNALTEGLAGIVDDAALFERVTLSPRWAIAGRRQARVALQYPASGAYFAYEWQLQGDGSISLTWGGQQTREVRLHLLLPHGMAPRQVVMAGTDVPFALTRVEESVYLDATLPGMGRVEIR